MVVSAVTASIDWVHGVSIMQGLLVWAFICIVLLVGSSIVMFVQVRSLIGETTRDKTV
jgi:hypothetical protein